MGSSTAATGAKFKQLSIQKRTLMKFVVNIFTSGMNSKSPNVALYSPSRPPIVWMHTLLVFTQANKAPKYNSRLVTPIYGSEVVKAISLDSVKHMNHSRQRGRSPQRYAHNCWYLLY